MITTNKRMKKKGFLVYSFWCIIPVPQCWQDSINPQARSSLLVPPVPPLPPAVSVCCLLQATEGQGRIWQRDTPGFSCSSEHLVTKTETVIPAVHSLLLALHYHVPQQHCIPLSLCVILGGGKTSLV